MAPQGKPAVPASINACLVRALRNSDVFVSRLALLFSTPSSTDSTLSLLAYSMILASHTLDKLLASRMELVASQIASRASKSLQPGETLVASLPVGEVLGARWARAADASERMKTARAKISDFRAFARLWGLLGLYGWAKGHWKSYPGARKPAAAEGEGEEEEGSKVNKNKYDPTANTTIRTIVWMQISACVAFQALENVGYLAQHGIIKLEPATTGKLFKWSSRGWCTHLTLELVRLWKTSQLTKQKRKDLAYSAAWEQEDDAWWKKLTTTSAWAPVALNFSVAPSYMFLNELGLGLCGGTASAVSVRELWKKSAPAV
ncbi:hypothetical protein P152DRAFT_183035 [Eremomyces bilateralis CBS 781.70]|uniref:Peroxin 11C n=1 Tax=Eremomyces bilateralis CBS 781.70 TaxID=1392243 RepID=A0A6G1GBD0_9PEZI|nr:uncharacterized protein P152DRAFT_183035 [Eremomyces bilateralis CBS 781.70]KAF1815353.1 hypothetical protein P152DRAFT_183035 [Eremomyces bilateralis CBS 781.70]